MKERRFTLHQLIDNTPMKPSIRQQHVTLGITGAVTIFVIGTLLIWAFSLGMAPRDYIWTLVMLVPIPIVTGSAAGMLIGFVWPSRTRGSFALGFVSMGLAVIFSVFLVSMLFPEINESDISRTTYLLSIYAILIFTGVIIQLMLVGSVLAIVKVIRIGSR